MEKDSSLDELKKKIETLKASQHAHFSTEKQPSPMGKYLTVGIELISGTLVGVGVGLLLDWMMNTRPLWLIIFFLFGSGAGMLNVYRALTRTDENKKNDHQDEDKGNRND